MSETLPFSCATEGGVRAARFGMSVIGALLWIFLFVQGLLHYQGQLSIYTAFSVVYLVLLFSGFYRSPGYGYLYFVVFLWLGFWLKVVLHLWLQYHYIEPIGSFDGSGAGWDNVLTVAMCGAAGVLIARYSMSFLRSQATATEESTAPAWYFPLRRLLWATLLVSIVVFAIVNATLGIQQIGLVPRTILLWPLNAVIAWLLNLGLATAVVTLLWWDILSRKKMQLPFYAIIFEAVFSGISILSRGLFLFHFLPGVVSVFKNRRRLSDLSLSKIGVYFICAGGAFFLSISAVTALRFTLFQSEQNRSGLAAYYEFSGMLGGRVIGQVLPLAADRWIGTEGLMAVSAYPEKSMDLLKQGLAERRQLGKTTMFQGICQSIYLTSDQTKWSFASLPGPIAFWYYSGTYWMVSAGMLLMTLLLFFIESAVRVVARNPLLSSLYGFCFANIFAQFGITPRADIPYCMMLAGGVGVVWLLQSKYFSILMAKAGWR